MRLYNQEKRRSLWERIDRRLSTAPSIARELIDRIINAPDKAAQLLAMVKADPPTVEDDWLDCKLEPTNQKERKQNEMKMKGMWLEALSGFANNEGGVLVWGLYARKDE